MLSWMSRHTSLSLRKKSRTGKSEPTPTHIRDDTKPKLQDDKRNANTTHIPNLPSHRGDEPQPKPGLLARRRQGIAPQTRENLVLQPKQRPSAMPPFLDSDFFTSTPDPTTLTFENLSPAQGSPCRSLSAEQASAMFETFTRERYVGERHETPECGSPCDIRGSEADFSAETSTSSEEEEGLCELLNATAIVSKPASVGGSEQVGAVKRNSDTPSTVPTSEILRLEEMSKVSVDKVATIMGMKVSVAPINKKSRSSDGPVEDNRVRYALAVDSELDTVDEFPPATSQGYSHFNELETLDATNAQTEEEDSFLYVAWTSMPAQARPSRPQRQHRDDVKPCAMPQPHPKIVAAEARMQAFKSTPKAKLLAEDIRAVSAYEDAAENAHIVGARWRIAAMSATVGFRAFLNDLVFVKMYEDKMKMRCARGVWWEGWIVIEDLRDQGVTGSVS